MEYGDRLVVLQQVLDEGQSVDLHVGRGLFLAEGVLRTEITSRILGRGLLDNSDISFSTKQG